MARKNKNSNGASEATEGTPTGTDSVLTESQALDRAARRRVVIPDPILPAREADDEEKKPNPVEEAPVRPDTQVPSSHLLGELSRGFKERAIARLTALSRANRDVKWVLAEYQKLSK